MPSQTTHPIQPGSHNAQFRDCDHNCKRKFHTAHYQKFQCIVKHCRVGTVSIYNRKHFVKLSLQIW